MDEAVTMEETGGGAEKREGEERREGVEVKTEALRGESYVRSVSPLIVDGATAHYGTQFFGFTPLAFSDGIYNSLISYAWELLEQLQLTLKKEFPDLVTNSHINKASADMFGKLAASFHRAFDKLECYLVENIFNVQDHVILPEDEVQENYTDAQRTEAELDDEIRQLKDKIQATKYMNARLKAEISDVDRIQEDLNKLIAEMQELERAAGGQNIGEYIGFIRGKAVDLKQRLENMDEEKRAEGRTAKRSI